MMKLACLSLITAPPMRVPFNPTASIRRPAFSSGGLRNTDPTLAPGGWFFIEVPSTDGPGAWQDPTHKSYWNHNSFHYYTHEALAQYIRPEFDGKFQLGWLETFESELLAGRVPYVRAHLIAIKPGMERIPGEVC